MENMRSPFPPVPQLPSSASSPFPSGREEALELILKTGHIAEPGLPLLWIDESFPFLMLSF